MTKLTIQPAGQLKCDNLERFMPSMAMSEASDLDEHRPGRGGSTQRKSWKLVNGDQ